MPGKCRYAGSQAAKPAADPHHLTGVQVGIRRASLVGVRGEVFTPMMKIQVIELDDRLILEVEGRLAGAFVPELENCWNLARAGRPERRILVDLKNVTCVDRS